MAWICQTKFKRYLGQGPVRSGMGVVGAKIHTAMRVVFVGLCLGGLVCAAFFCMGFWGRVMIEFAKASTDVWRTIFLGAWGIAGAAVCGVAGFVIWFKMRNRRTIDLDYIAFLLGAALGWLLTLGLGLFSSVG